MSLSLERGSSSRLAVAIFAGIFFVAALRGVSLGVAGLQQLIALGGLVCATWVFPKAASADEPISPLSTVAGALLAGLVITYLCTSFIAAVAGWSVDWVQGARDFRDLLLSALIAMASFAAVRRAPGDVPVAFCLAGTAAAACEILLYDRSLYQVLFVKPFAGYRTQGGFSGPNEYAAYLSLIGAAGVGLLVSGPSRFRRGLGAVALGVSAFALVRTLSRGGLLGLGLGGLSAIVVGYRLLGPRVRWVGVPVAGLITGLLLFKLVGGVASGSQIAGLAARLSDRGVSGGFSDRARLADAALQITDASWGLGSGLGSFSAQNQRYGGTGTLSPHNEVFKAAGEGGFLAAAGTAGLMLVILIAAWRSPVASRPVWVGMAVSWVTAEQFFTYLVRPGVAVSAAVIFGAMFGTKGSLSGDTDRNA